MATDNKAGVPETIPKWKKDLIQRRRQQTKVLANNGASVKLCSAVIGGASAQASESFDSNNVFTSNVSVSGGQESARGEASSEGKREGRGGEIGGAPGGTFGRLGTLVAGNMRLDADALCPEPEDVLGCTLNDKPPADSRTVIGKLKSDMELARSKDSEVTTKGPEGDQTTTTKVRSGKMPSEDGESDSSEELQYGPGIVNRLKSKYLNLALREMNKTRTSVQSFRRAASLEDLLDCDEDPTGKASRKYTKRSIPGVTAKSDRYRNASRGNDSMKRARSVETLLRYNSVSDDVIPHSVPSRFIAGVTRQEPTNDHIILIDRTSVKIESRLADPERPKPLNKPKRVKPVLAETERPPPDLVKTTMRLFEGSTRKLKPKGEVAAKVATFKTINDTYKAQNLKKIIPKPPLQPKPFANGTAKPPGSPKKTVPQKPIVDKVDRSETREEYHNDGVITEPIVQSVSSVVSKFRQIEKSHSPSPSPEPLSKFIKSSSPVPSPEPPVCHKPKISPETKVKSPPSTPEPRLLPSPRISPPAVILPSSPKKDFFRQNSSPVLKTSPPVREFVRQTSVPASPKAVRHRPDEQEDSSERVGSPEILETHEEDVPRSPSPMSDDEEDMEPVDGTKTVSKTALDNISKAGTTMQFSFKDKDTPAKSYLPGVSQNGQKSVESLSEIVETSDSNSAPPTPPAETKNPSISSQDIAFLLGNVPSDVDDTSETSPRLQECLEPEEPAMSADVKPAAETKPIGAISSLGLIKSSTTTSYPQCNESKTIKIEKSQKSDAPSPPQKQIGIIRPLVSTKTQMPQQNLSNRELEKNLINRVKNIETPTKVVVSMKSAEEIQPVKKTNSGGGLWDTKPWNQQNNTMVFNFSNRKEVPDYIENDGLIIRRKRDKPKVGDGGVIVLDSTTDASSTDDAEWEMSGGPPSPCDVTFLNDNVLINGRSNLSKQPRNHKHRIQFDDTATRTFEYPSEASMMGGDVSSVEGDLSTKQPNPPRESVENKPPSVSPTPGLSTLLGGGGLASYTPSKVDLASEGFQLGVTRASISSQSSTSVPSEQPESLGEDDYLKPAQDAGAWGSETTADLLF